MNEVGDQQMAIACFTTAGKTENIQTFYMHTPRPGQGDK